MGFPGYQQNERTKRKAWFLFIFFPRRKRRGVYADTFAGVRAPATVQEYKPITQTKMDELFKECNERLPLVDVVKIGDYKEVEDYDLVTITKNKEDKNKKLNGLLIYGYETKFADGTNENGERFSKDALDKFLESYYVKRKLNMPLTCMHGYRREDQIGRVLIIEVNSVGFYFVCYIPKGIDEYDDIKLKIQEGILQGLSKEGWSTKGKVFYTKNGDFDYYLVEEMEMLGVSLVTTPANGNPLEKAKEIKNGLQFIKRQDNAPEVDAFGAMFN